MAIPAAIMTTALAGWLGNKGQSDANRTNVRLQREQQAWEQMMSNTAVFRRARDIEQAGGNRALAFTNGQEASTPSVAPARVESTMNQAAQSLENLPAKAMAMGQFKAQWDNTRAQTELTRQQSRSLEIRNNVDNAFAMNVAAVNYDIREAKKQNMAIEYDKMKAEIEKTVAETRRTEGLTMMTAAELKRFDELTPKMIDLAIQQVKAGQIDLDALENIAKLGGVEASKAAPIAQGILTAIKLFLLRK